MSAKKSVTKIPWPSVLATSLAGAPFHVSSSRLQRYSDQLVHFLSQHQSLVAGTVVTGGRIILELLTGLILTVFITFFLLKDGRRIWGFVVSGLRPDARRRAAAKPDRSPDRCANR